MLLHRGGYQRSLLSGRGRAGGTRGAGVRRRRLLRWHRSGRAPRHSRSAGLRGGDMSVLDVLERAIGDWTDDAYAVRSFFSLHPPRREQQEAEVASIEADI